jgi:photosystem II stability/assembly factor-like uncharacterized protein
VIAAGGLGVYANYTSDGGASWRQSLLASDHARQGLWGDGLGFYVAVGGQGEVESSFNAGLNFRYDDLGVDAGSDYFGVWGADASTQLLVGSGGAIYARSGGAGSPWNAVHSGGATLRAIWGANGASLLVAVGGQGTILVSRDGGQSWTQALVDGAAELAGVWGSGPGDLWAVGAGGTILHSTDGGQSWPAQGAPTANDLQAIWGSGPDDLWIVGAGGTILHGP